MQCAPFDHFAFHKIRTMLNILLTLKCVVATKRAIRIDTTFLNFSKVCQGKNFFASIFCLTFPLLSSSDSFSPLFLFQTPAVFVASLVKYLYVHRTPVRFTGPKMAQRNGLKKKDTLWGGK